MRKHFQSLNWWLSSLWGKHNIAFFVLQIMGYACTYACVHNWRHLAQRTMPSYQDIHENCTDGIHSVISFCKYPLKISFYFKKVDGFNFLTLESLQFDLVNLINSIVFFWVLLPSYKIGSIVFDDFQDLIPV